MREELCRDFAFPVLAWQAKYEQIYLLGTSIARPLISKVCLRSCPRSGCDRVCPRSDRQRQRPMSIPIGCRGPEPGDRNDRSLANQRVSRCLSRSHRTDRLLRAKKIFPSKHRRRNRTAATRTCLHISYEAGKLEDLTVNGVELVDFGMGVSPQEAPDKSESVTIGFESGVPMTVNGAKLSALEMVEAAERDRRSQRCRSHRHGRKPICRHEEPRCLRIARHDRALQRADERRTIDDGSRL